jgi:hypothetical protein
VLVLADISGFTAFVTATELEHGPPIIAALLEEVIGELSPPLEIHQVEGDAVFALGPDGVVTPPALLWEVLQGAVVAFKARQREMADDRSCSCHACRSVSNLSLKIVAHHGRFLRHAVGGREQVAGADVILAHRLLKNHLVETPCYVLLTETALRWVGMDGSRAGLVAHTEHYDHLGDVRCFVKDLGAARSELAHPLGLPARQVVA